MKGLIDFTQTWNRERVETEKIQKVEFNKRIAWMMFQVLSCVPLNACHRAATGFLTAVDDTKG